MRLPVDGHTPEKLDEGLETVNQRMYRQFVLAGGAISYEEFRKIQNAYNQSNMDRLKYDLPFQKQAATTYDCKNGIRLLGYFH
jgi:hypothetical protein